jgi:hypothetical protein
MKLTETNIRRLETEKGGYTKATLIALGVQWDDIHHSGTKGWRRKLIDSEISDDQYRKAWEGRETYSGEISASDQLESIFLFKETEPEDPKSLISQLETGLESEVEARTKYTSEYTTVLINSVKDKNTLGMSQALADKASLSSKEKLDSIKNKNEITRLKLKYLHKIEE